MSEFEGQKVHEMIRDAIAEEREACAKLAEEMYAGANNDEESAALFVAQAIRERGTT